MMRSVLKGLDTLTALFMSSWTWLTPRAKFYKASALAVVLLLLLAMLDRAFVLPRFDGWVGIVSLAAAAGLALTMASRWHEDEGIDVPRRWIAPIRSANRP